MYSQLEARRGELIDKIQPLLEKAECGTLTEVEKAEFQAIKKKIEELSDHLQTEFF